VIVRDLLELGRAVPYDGVTLERRTVRRSALAGLDQLVARRIATSLG